MRVFLGIFCFIFLIATSGFTKEDSYLTLPFKTLDGKKITISQLKGKPVLLEYWASWCLPCKISIHHTNRLAKKFKKKAHIIGINTDIENLSELREIIEDMEIDFTIWLNNSDGNFVFGGVSSLPTFVILDKDGNFIKKIVGIKKNTEEELESILLELSK